MTLSEAHKTGRKIRRKSSKVDGHTSWFKLTNKWYGLNYGDAIADDWEVEPEKKLAISLSVWMAISGIGICAWQALPEYLSFSIGFITAFICMAVDNIIEREYWSWPK